MHTVLPFSAFFIGNGTATTFALDTNNDPFFFENNESLNGAEAISLPTIPPFFNFLSTPSRLIMVEAKNSANNNDLGFSSYSISGSVITFTLSPAPADGVLVDIFGFIAY